MVRRIGGFKKSGVKLLRRGNDFWFELSGRLDRPDTRKRQKSSLAIRRFEILRVQEIELLL